VLAGVSEQANPTVPSPPSPPAQADEEMEIATEKASRKKKRTTEQQVTRQRWILEEVAQKKMLLLKHIRSLIRSLSLLPILLSISDTSLIHRLSNSCKRETD
jgi:hypothetical protein